MVTDEGGAATTQFIAGGTDVQCKKPLSPLNLKQHEYFQDSSTTTTADSQY